MTTSIQTASVRASSNESWYQYAVRDPVGLIADKVDAFMNSTSLPFPEKIKNCNKRVRVYEIVRLAMIGTVGVCGIGGLSLLVTGASVIGASIVVSNAIALGACIPLFSKVVECVREEERLLTEPHGRFTEQDRLLRERDRLVNEQHRLLAEQDRLVNEQHRLLAD